MDPLTISYLVVSLALLIVGISCHRLTNSRGLIVTTFFGSFGLLFGAHQLHAVPPNDFPLILPFFAAMVYGGRGIAFWWRSRKEPELALPARLLLIGSVCALAVAVAGFAFRTI
jgi:peptidoglycan/LPS O-acetylase OafA/YrhL